MGGRVRGPRKWVVVLLSVTGALIVFGVVVGFFTGLGPYDLPPQSRRLEETLAVSRSLGLPMTQEELVGPKPPDEENAAPEVYRIGGALRFSNTRDVNARPGSAAHLAEQAKWISEHESQLDRLVATLRERKGWHVERDYDLGPILSFSDLAALTTVSKALMARGVNRAVAGDTDGAISDFSAVRSLSERLATEHTLISMLVGISIDSIAFRDIEHYVDAWKSNPKGLQELEVSILSTKHRKDLSQALRGEFYIQLNLCRNYRLYGGLAALGMVSAGAPVTSLEPSEIKRSGLPTGMFTRASMTVIAENWNVIFSTFGKGGTMDRGCGAFAQRRGEEMGSRNRTSERLGMISMPVYAQAEDALIKDDVSQDIAVAFVRCMRYRAEHNRWPSSLKEVGADFSDPFAPGKAIQAKFGPNELRVWSVGRDRTDDGGKIKNPGEEGEDTVFVWPPSLRHVPR